MTFGRHFSTVKSCLRMRRLHRVTRCASKRRRNGDAGTAAHDTGTWLQEAKARKQVISARCCIEDKMSYMHAQNFGVVSLESYSRALLNLAALKVRTRL